MTTDTARDIENYRQELRDLVGKRDELDQEILHVTSVLQMLVGKKGIAGETKRKVLNETKAADWKKPSLKRSAVEILRKSEHRLTRKQVVERLKAAGLLDPNEYAQASSAVQTTLKRLEQDREVLSRRENGRLVYYLPLPIRVRNS
jgi:chromosome segregation ATPase